MADQSFTKITEYLEQQPVVTLSTTSDDTTPYGAIIYLFTLDDDRLYFVTKKSTQKYQNLQAHPTVSLTSASDDRSATLQVTGQAYDVTDGAIVDAAKRKLTRVHPHKIAWVPPIIQLEAGDAVVVGVDIMSARLGIFSGEPGGEDEIYTYIG